MILETLQVQHATNGGKCGECGDRYDESRPRANEGGGTYAKGIIVRNYTRGQVNSNTNIMMPKNPLFALIFADN